MKIQFNMFLEAYITQAFRKLKAHVKTKNSRIRHKRTGSHEPVFLCRVFALLADFSSGANYGCMYLGYSRGSTISAVIFITFSKAVKLNLN